MLSVNCKNVMAETVKMAEDGSGVILRMFEYYNARGPVDVTLGAKAVSVKECDLMENVIGNVDCAADGMGFSFDIKPFEIKTFKVEFQK